MVGCYTFPVTGQGDPLIDPPNRQGSADEDHPLPPMDLDFGGGDGEVPAQDQDGHHPLPPMDLWGGGEAVHEDEVLADDDGDPPPRPEDSADLQDPHDPLQEEAPPPPGPDGAAEAEIWVLKLMEPCLESVGGGNQKCGGPKFDLCGGAGISKCEGCLAGDCPHSCPPTSTGLAAVENPL